jgi:hypothetical protein
MGMLSSGILLHVSISAIPSSTDGEDAAAVLTAHAEPPPVSVFVVMGDPCQTVQFRLWPERIAKTEIGLFRPDGVCQEDAAIAGAGAEEGEVTRRAAAAACPIEGHDLPLSAVRAVL